MKKVIFVCTLLISAATVCTAADKSDISQISTGTSRDEIHSLIGEPQSISAGGYKEIYHLENGKTAVLTYIDDILNDGFIVINR